MSCSVSESDERLTLAGESVTVVATEVVRPPSPPSHGLRGVSTHPPELQAASKIVALTRRRPANEWRLMDMANLLRRSAGCTHPPI